MKPRARNWRWEEVAKDTIELDLLIRHFELFNTGSYQYPDLYSSFESFL